MYTLISLSTSLYTCKNKFVYINCINHVYLLHNLILGRYSNANENYDYDIIYNVN